MPQSQPNTGHVIIVSGPVAAGKSTVSRELVANASSTIAYIEGDTFWPHIIGRREDQSRHREFRTIMRAMTASAVAYALSGYETILDFSIPPWFLDTVRKVSGARGVTVHFVVLRPDIEVCAARGASRRDGRIDDYNPYRDLYADFETDDRHMVDVGGAPSTIASAIRAGVESGQFRLTG